MLTSSIRVTLDKNDKEAIYYPDLIGANMGIKEAKENLKKTLNHLESRNREIDDCISSIPDILNSYFEVKP